MKQIFYGLAGEGLGHACRTQAIVENLSDCQVHLFTWGEAWDFFHKQHYPHLHRIVGIPFGRGKGNKIDIWKTIQNFTKYLEQSQDSVKYVLMQAERHKPDLFVSDFEGIVPQAARKFGKPLLSIDNQHKFSRTTDKNISLSNRLYAFLMGLYAEWLCPKPDMAVISTFYHSAVKKKFCDKTLLTNCFMRKQIEEIDPTIEDYVLVYYKSSVGPAILEALSKTKERVVVFNYGGNGYKNFEHHNVSGTKFINYLAGCKAVFCAAGNQLLGEASFYGKPVFTIPEPNQPEQSINAHYISEMKYGVSTPLSTFKPEMVNHFLENLHKWKHNCTINGVHIAVEQIRKFSDV